MEKYVARPNFLFLTHPGDDSCFQQEHSFVAPKCVPLSVVCMIAAADTALTSNTIAFYKLNCCHVGKLINKETIFSSPTNNSRNDYVHAFLSN